MYSSFVRKPKTESQKKKYQWKRNYFQTSKACSYIATHFPVISLSAAVQAAWFASRTAVEPGVIIVK